MCGLLLVWGGFSKFKVPEDGWQPIREPLSDLKAEVTWHEGKWGVGVNELLLQCWGTMSCGGVMSAQPHPRSFLGWSSTCQTPWAAPKHWLREELGPRTTTTNSMDTVDSYGPEWLPRIWWALYAQLAAWPWPVVCRSVWITGFPKAIEFFLILFGI